MVNDGKSAAGRFAHPDPDVRPRQAKVIVRELFIALFVRTLEKCYVFKGDVLIPIHFYPDLFSGVGGGGGIY